MSPKRSYHPYSSNAPAAPKSSGRRTSESSVRHDVTFKHTDYTTGGSRPRASHASGPGNKQSSVVPYQASGSSGQVATTSSSGGGRRGPAVTATISSNRSVTARETPFRSGTRHEVTYSETNTARLQWYEPQSSSGRYVDNGSYASSQQRQQAELTQTVYALGAYIVPRYQ